jgi:hypothetical protein
MPTSCKQQTEKHICHFCWKYLQENLKFEKVLVDFFWMRSYVCFKLFTVKVITINYNVLVEHIIFFVFFEI